MPQNNQNINQTNNYYDYLDSVLQGKYLENYINKKKLEEMEKNSQLINDDIKKLVESTKKLNDTLENIN